MKTFPCPVCKKPLTIKEYEEALGILEERKRQHRRDLLDLRKKLEEARIKEKRAKANGIKIERARSQRLLAGQRKKVHVLEQRIAQLEKGTTPQTEGLEFEETLADRLRKEFPDDEIQHTGKGGDILQLVNSKDKQTGTIIYECKRTHNILISHINQANRAKQLREADFSVLVTTGQNKSFSGLSQRDGVLVVSPLGVIPLACLLRSHLIEILRLQVTKDERAVIVQRLMKYITGPEFKNPLEEIIRDSSDLQEMIREEFKQHLDIWEKRSRRYQRIHWDGSRIQRNMQLVLNGEELEAAAPFKSAPLQLPAPF